MFKYIRSFLALLLMLGLAAPAMAQGPFDPQHSDPFWQATYWNNTSLSGASVLQRQETNLAHDWGAGSPANEVNADRFSARWTRYIDVTPGTYRFTVTSDDGIRLWVDNALILDKWSDHPSTTYTVDKYLGSGHHMIKVEYYENTGYAVAKLSWTLLGQDQPSQGEWRGEYFNNVTLSGSPAAVRQDTAVDFNWGTNSPIPGTISADRFSARWTRTLDLAAAMYHFSLTVDDGARLWVNGHLLIDAWQDQAATTYTGDIYLPGGSVTIEVQYYENTGHAVAKLAWSTEGTPPEPPTPPSGAVIVDDMDSGFEKHGAWGGWRTVYEGYSGRLTWTYNNDTTRRDYNWARWYPSLQNRRYEVYVYIPHRYTTTGSARYWISHANGMTLKVVDQSAYGGGQWVSLGTYTFRGTRDDFVSLADVTFEPYRSRLIGFDAVKWEPR